MTQSESNPTFEQQTDKSLPTGYLAPSGAWMELPPDNEEANGNESIISLMGLLARCLSPGIDPRMRGIAGKAFRDSGITGIMVQVTQGKTDSDFTVQTHVLRAEAQEEAAPCAGE